MTTDAQEILRARGPEDVFPGDLDKSKELFRELARRWHPDKPGGDSAVMAKVNELYDEAVIRIREGRWQGKASLRLRLDSMKELNFKYLISRPFELGQQYIGDTHVSYLVEKEHRPLLTRAESFVREFRYARPDMEQEMSKYLPKDVKSYLLHDGRVLLKTPKTSDLLSLRDVLSHCGGAVDPRHVAWICSGMHNIACYLRWAKLVHMNFSLDSVFISPELHGVALLGGWWYAAKEGEGLKYLPTRTFDFLPWSVRSSKEASYLVDLEMIRATARELLGDINGTKLKKPEPMVNWLKLPAAGEPVDVYRAWQEALVSTFGKRRFVKMKLDSKEVYPTTRR